MNQDAVKQSGMNQEEWLKHEAQTRAGYHAQFEMVTPFGPCLHKVSGLSMQAHDAQLGHEQDKRIGALA